MVVMVGCVVVVPTCYNGGSVLVSFPPPLSGWTCMMLRKKKQLHISNNTDIRSTILRLYFYIAADALLGAYLMGTVVEGTWTAGVWVLEVMTAAPIQGSAAHRRPARLLDPQTRCLASFTSVRRKRRSQLIWSLLCNGQHMLALTVMSRCTRRYNL
ncbi:hypothetical protein E2C01_035293 [Portunus trituberculatus]|uniref:Uncharacterized protein n=1 Tax=Portunus trituberculatus TaxID=210409 RepID=A0A5B7F9D8_PORTR|nr:hypothetical protein [Portunus trituberculatus]